MKSKDAFDKWKDITQIVSLIAMPLLLAIFGFLFQNTMKDKEIRRDYIQIATGILSNASADPKLRTWATKLIQENSPTPFGEDVAARLQLPDSGFSGIPRVPEPHKEIMEDPGEERLLPKAVTNMKRWEVAFAKALAEEDDHARVDALASILQESLDAYQEATLRADKSTFNLRYLQDWSRMIMRSQGVIPGTEGRYLEPSAK